MEKQLPTDLGRLRVQLEMQLQLLGDAEHAIDRLPFRAAVQRPKEAARLVSHLGEMRATHEVIGEAITRALAIAERLHQTERAES